jgi:hypothetical protein
MPSQDVSALTDFLVLEDVYNCIVYILYRCIDLLFWKMYIIVKYVYTWLDRMGRDTKRIKDSTKSNVLFTNELGFSKDKFSRLIDAICNNQSIKKFDMQVCPLLFSIYQTADFTNRCDY